MRTDRGEIGGGVRGAGRGRTGSSTKGIGTTKVKAPSAKAKKAIKAKEELQLKRAERMLETGQSARRWRPEKPVTTGKAKAEAFKENVFKMPTKNSGKLKYQGVTKQTRLHSQKPASDMVSVINPKTGKIRSASEVKATAKVANKKMGNIAKSIDREMKEIKGQRKAKPTTPKVPVKKKSK